ncbi:cobyric acid synthase [Coprothermobacter platensis]|uniref:cobyric acid synthase n=1 Tax=Coprothermobacter platensis TaxID=108819 RepID=UPI0003A47AC4
MLQGTGSGVGKSVLTAALLRIMKHDGFKVAPFKAQNMALNSFVTKDGLEMGRAQAMQAEAAGIEPDVRMNPILLKPTSDTGSQVIVMGKPLQNMCAVDYENYKPHFQRIILEAFNKLKKDYDFVILEGAGSPAEINLMEHDIVNMGMARLIDCPVLLVGDIDKGGVFASLVGTLTLLPKDKDRIKGFIINKFRGDISILQPGLDMLKEITGLPTLGVIPYFHLKLDEEDTPSEHSISQGKDIDIAVIFLPHISNFTDFDPLTYYPGVNLRYVKSAEEIGNPDIIIFPGSKNTIGDLETIRKAGIVDKVVDFYHRGGYVIGVCGGYQIMGKKIFDPLSAEAGGESDGLGIFDMETTFENEKLTVNAEDVITKDEGLLKGLSNVLVKGYEIHMGRTNGNKNDIASKKELIALDASGRALGTYLHGIFENTQFTTCLLNNIRQTKGLPPMNVDIDYKQKKEEQYDALADIVRKNLNMEFIYNLMK